jgi:hypothetical protein
MGISKTGATRMNARKNAEGNWEVYLSVVEAAQIAALDSKKLDLLNVLVDRLKKGNRDVSTALRMAFSKTDKESAS